MPALEAPSAIRASTSRSRGDSTSSGSRRRRARTSSWTRDGSTTDAPAVIRSTVSMNSATSVTRLFSRYPRPCPPASSSIASSTSTCADSTIIAVPGSSSRITRAACRPSVACAGGIRMSMIASSGWTERTRASSSVPFPAWPTTSNPERSSKLARPSRRRTSSSASTTRVAHRLSDAVSGIPDDVGIPRLSTTRAPDCGRLCPTAVIGSRRGDLGFQARSTRRLTPLAICPLATITASSCQVKARRAAPYHFGLVAGARIRLSGVGHYRKLARHRRAVAQRAVHGEGAAERLDTVLQPDQPGAPERVGATGTVVTHIHPERAARGGHLHRDNRRPRVPGHVGERLRDDVIRRHLDGLREPPYRGNVKLDRDRGPAGERPQRRAKPALGQDRRVDAAGNLTQILHHLVQLIGDLVELCLQLGQLGRHHALGQAKLQAERNQALLGPVV